MKNDELNQIYKKISQLTNAANQPLVAPNPVNESKVKLIPDSQVSPGKFKQSRVNPNIYYAQELTIAALKKDLFLIGEGFEDLENIRKCEDCQRSLDTQFWKFCPYCEGQFQQ